MVFIRPAACPKSSELLECLSEHLILHTYGLDKTRMPERQLHHLLYLSKLLLASSNIIVCHIWLLLNLHHRDSSINLGWQGQNDIDF